MKLRLTLILTLVLVSCNTTSLSTASTADTPTGIFVTKFAPSQVEPTATEAIHPSITWTPPPTPTLRANVPLEAGKTIIITSLQMFDQQNGWGFDNGDHILRTHDGGNTWQDATPPFGNFPPKGFFAIDERNAWTTFSQGLYSEPTSAFSWHTTDGGENWQAGEKFSLKLDLNGNTYPADYYLPIMMQFIDMQNGWLLVDVYSGMNSTHPLLFQTNDSGKTWNLINDHYHDLDSAVAAGFAFIDKQTGWLGQNAIPLRFGMNKIDEIISDGNWHTAKTTDGGVSFPTDTLLPFTNELENPEYATKIADCGETKMTTIPPQVVGIEWSCLIYLDERQDLIRTFSLTSNGGDSWFSFPSSGNEFFLHGNHGWRLLSPGALQYTNDGGLMWTTIKSVAWETAQFDFVNEQEGWAIVGNDDASALVHTVDGGFTWSEIKPTIVP
jgi:photosystem II stability/assembly factor-like uncharacterized protein